MRADAIPTRTDTIPMRADAIHCIDNQINISINYRQ
jgi:hypothetical protein